MKREKEREVRCGEGLREKVVDLKEGWRAVVRRLKRLGRGDEAVGAWGLGAVGNLGFYLPSLGFIWGYSRFDVCN